MTGVSSIVPPRFRRPELLTAGIVLGGLAVMEAIVATGLVSPILLRQPTEIFGELVVGVGTPTVQAHVQATAQRVIAAFLISAVVGAVLSLALWRNATLRAAYLPLLGAIFGTPLILLYVVFVVIFGRGSVAIISISVPLGVIPIVINSTDALASVEDIYLDTARSFNATRSQLLRKVIIPDAAPDIFTGVRIGFTYILISVTAVEFLLVTGEGLGGMIAGAYFRFRTTEMFVGITLIILLVIVAIFVLRRVEEAIRR